MNQRILALKPASHASSPLLSQDASGGLTHHKWCLSGGISETAQRILGVKVENTDQNVSVTIIEMIIDVIID